MLPLWNRNIACTYKNVDLCAIFVFKLKMQLWSFFSSSFPAGGKTNELTLQNNANKAIIQGLIPDQGYTVQIVALAKDQESKAAQGQFRSMFSLPLSMFLTGLCKRLVFEMSIWNVFCNVECVLCCLSSHCRVLESRFQSRKEKPPRMVQTWGARFN